MRDTHQTKFNKDIELVQRKATRYYIRPVGYSSGIPATRSWLQDQEQPSGDATSYLLHIWREKKKGWPYNQIDQSNKGSLQQLFFPALYKRLETTARHSISCTRNFNSEFSFTEL